jgi:hypothetical protein
MEGKRAGCEVRGCTEVEGGCLFRVSKTEAGAGGLRWQGTGRGGGGGAREASCVGLAELLPPYDKSRYLEIRNLEGEVVGKEDGS